MRTYKLFCWLLPLFLLSVFFILLFFCNWMKIINYQQQHSWLRLILWCRFETKKENQTDLTIITLYTMITLAAAFNSTAGPTFLFTLYHECLWHKKKDMIKIYSSVRVHDFKKTLIFVCVHFLNHFLKMLQFIKNISLFMLEKWWLPSDTVIWIYHLN